MKFIGILLIVVELITVSAFALAESRTALIIGNSNYQYGKLRNPVNDAKDMAKTLKMAGFNVVLKLDASQKAMDESIRDFGSNLHAGGIGLFYFSGHGIQVSGENYLLPIGSIIVNENDVKYKAVNIGQVLDEMGSARNGLNIVIMDACRNNPLERSFRSSTKGLARITGPRGTLIAYSTEPGSVASDGNGNNSPYTLELMSAIKSPGLQLEQVFKKVLKGVYKRTNGRQTPWISSSFMGDFSFTPNMPEQITSPLVTSEIIIDDKNKDETSEDEILSFIDNYIIAASNNDLSNFLSFYADNVDYFGAGIVSRSFIRDDKRNYYKRWSNVEIRFIRLVDLVKKENGQTNIVKYLVEFDVYSRSRGKGVKGISEKTIIVKNDQGNLKIISDKEKLQKKEDY